MRILTKLLFVLVRSNSNFGTIMSENAETVAVSESLDVVTTPSELEVLVPEDKKTNLITTAGSGFGVVTYGLGSLPQLRDDMSIVERQSAIREIVKKSLDMPDRMDLMTGELLYEIWKNGYWKDYSLEVGETGRPYVSFDEYAELELGIKRRKAYYLIEIYEKFVINLGLPMEVLGTLEWSKAKEVVSVITPDNWLEIVDKMKTMTVKEIKEWVKGLKGTSGTKADADDAVIKRSYSLHLPQAEVVDQAIKLAKSMMDNDKDGYALEMVCSDFLSSSCGCGLEGALSRVDVAVKNIERAFGVKLSIESIDEARYDKLDRATTV